MHAYGEGARALRILIVEDEILLAMDLESHLSVLGHDMVGIAADASEAFALANTTAPDLALVDLNLRDGRSGPEIAARLARDHSAIVIFVTGNPEQIPPDYAGALGAITKPWDPGTIEQVLSFVHSHLSSQPGLTGAPAKMLIAPAFRNKGDDTLAASF